MKIFLRFSLLLSLLLISSLNAQNNQPQLKTEAMKHMQSGRYGEAIDLLNKYISANPQNYSGLYLRGLCYEKRGQFDNASLDLKRALKLAPQNREVQQSIYRIENVWKKKLYDKIEGHKREIAINPNKAVSYLEIGKAKKDLGLWKEAEDWYDNYLRRQEASADEIIRYTEILSHNNQLSKGERILKTYTSKYPDDQRLWSRYGYFTLWLGKHKIAITAFEQALRIKPFFKEAQDGLDQAKGKAYLYTYTDTTARKKQQPAFEYAIDKYYRIVKSNPKDHKTRFLLVEELYQNKRMEEAYEQLKLLPDDYADNEKYQKYWENITAIRDSLFAARIEEYKAVVENDPANSEAAIKLAENYGYIGDYDNAVATLEKLLLYDTEKKNFEARYRYAQYLAWNHQFEQAIEQISYLLEADSNNLKFQLLRAQIAVWAVQDLELGEKYLNNIISKEPKNFEAILTMSYLNVWKKNFSTAKKYLELASRINPGHKEIGTVQDLYDRALSAEEEMKIFRILVAGRELAVAQKCNEALVKYDEYFSKITAPNRALLMEYADVSLCAANYTKALEIYDTMLEKEYDFDIAFLRAKVFLMKKDTMNAVREFEKLATEDSSHFETQLYLGESYSLSGQDDKALGVFNHMLTATDDSARTVLIKRHISWVPVRGFKGFLASFPRALAFSPVFSFYSDNNNLDYRNTGGRLELGISDHLSAGLTFQRGTMKGNMLNRNFSSLATRNFTSLKMNLYFRISPLVSASASAGMMNYQSSRTGKTFEGSVFYEKPKRLSASLTFESGNSGILLYSPKMLDLMIDAVHYRGAVHYYGVNGLHIQGGYHYISIDDANKGNDLQLRLGREFNTEITGGYEYYYSSYARKSNYYYSPSNFESHSLWAAWDLQKSSDLTLNLSGKLGYVPSSDFIVRELSGEILYKPYEILILSGKFTAGGSYRYDSEYSYTSAFVSAYLKIY